MGCCCWSSVLRSFRQEMEAPQFSLMAKIRFYAVVNDRSQDVFVLIIYGLFMSDFLRILNDVCGTTSTRHFLRCSIDPYPTFLPRLHPLPRFIPSTFFQIPNPLNRQPQPNRNRYENPMPLRPLPIPTKPPNSPTIHSRKDTTNQ